LPPNIVKAVSYYNQLILEFDQEIYAHSVENLMNVLRVIRFNSEYLEFDISGIEIVNNYLLLTLDNNIISEIETVSYAGHLPAGEYDLDCYLRNSDNIAALSFANIEVFPVKSFFKGNKFLENKIDELAQDIEILVYPNPANGKLFVEVPSNENKWYIQLYNIYGQMLLERTVSERKTDLNIFNLISGTYYIKVISESGFEDIKLIIKN
jgi:type IX secretion system substrate protein